MTISVTGASDFLRGSDDSATLVVPGSALGSMAAVNAVITRLSSLNRAVDSHYRAMDEATARASRDAARAGPRSAAAVDGASGGGGSGGHGGGLLSGLLGGAEHVAEMSIARRILGAVVLSPASRALGLLGRGASAAARGGIGAIGRFGVGRALGVVGGALGAYDLYQQASRTGQVSVLDSALTGASIGGTIGSFVPVVGTAIGAALGAAVGTLGGLAYNNSDAIVSAWRGALGKVREGTDAVVATTRAAWSGTVTGFQKMSSMVGHRLSEAWDGVTASFREYGGRVDKWVETQAHNVDGWLRGIVREIEASVSSFGLRQLGLEFLSHLRTWLLDRLGFGGGGGGGGGGDAPGGTPGSAPPIAVPDANGALPNAGPAGLRAGAKGAAPAAPRGPVPSMYSPGSSVTEAAPALHGRAALGARARGAGPAVKAGDIPNITTYGGGTSAPKTGTDADTPMPGVGITTPGGKTMYGPTVGSAVGFGPGGIVPHVLAERGKGATVGPASDVPTMYSQGGRTTATATIPNAERVATQDPNIGAGYGLDHPALTSTPGRRPDTKDVDPRLLRIMAAAKAHLPSGYNVTINEGFNQYGHAAHSQHHVRGSGALDLQITDDKGRPIFNEGGDPTGMYTRLARAAKGEQMKLYPELTGKFAWGGAFGTVTGGTTSDLMHFDLGNDRGHIMNRRMANLPVWKDDIKTDIESRDRAEAVQSKPIDPSKLSLGAYHHRADEADADAAGEKVQDLGPASKRQAALPDDSARDAEADALAAKVHGDAPSIKASSRSDTVGHTGWSEDGHTDDDLTRFAKVQLGPGNYRPGVQAEILRDPRARRFQEDGYDGSRFAMRGGDSNLKASFSPGHAAGVSFAPDDVKATNLGEKRGAAVPPPPPPEEHEKGSTDTPPQSKHGSASLDDIPKVHHNVHIAVSGHTDRFA